MSLLCFLVAICYYMNEEKLETEFFITWALFSIADALWLKLGRR